MQFHDKIIKINLNNRLSCPDGYVLEKVNGRYVCNLYENAVGLQQPIDLVILRDMSSSISGIDRPHPLDKFPSRDTWDFADSYPDRTGYDDSIFDEGQPLRGGLYNGQLIDELQESRNFIIQVVEGFRDYIETGDVRVSIVGYSDYTKCFSKNPQTQQIGTTYPYLFNTNYQDIIDIISGMEDYYINNTNTEGTRTFEALDSVASELTDKLRDNALARILTITDGVPDTSPAYYNIKNSTLEELSNINVHQVSNIRGWYFSQEFDQYHPINKQYQLPTPLRYSMIDVKNTIIRAFEKTTDT